MRRKKSKKKREVKYQIHIDGCDISFIDNGVNAKRYKHVELCLTGIAKLLNLVRDTDDWEKFTLLMDAVVEELATDQAEIERAERKTPLKTDYVV